MASRLVCRVWLAHQAAVSVAPWFGAEIAVVGLVGDPELELGEPVPQRGHRGEGVGQFGVADRPESWVPELVEVGVEPCDQGSDRVRLWFAEYRCHTGNSGIDHRHSRAQNRPRFRDVDNFFRLFSGALVVVVSTSSTTGDANHRLAVAD